MAITKGHWLLLLFTLTYTLGFGAYYVSIQNLEFLWYVATLLGLIVFIGTTLKHSQLPSWVLWLLSLWGLLHMAGGGVVVGDSALYRYLIWPFYVDGVDPDFVIFKFDQFVHAYGFGISAIALLLIFERWTKGTVGPRALAATAVLSAMGLGVANEIVEFAAVIVFSETGVGGYYNVSLDLVFNTLGALIAIGLLYIVRRLKNHDGRKSQS